MSAPIFIVADSDEILAEVQAALEAELGYPVPAASPEGLLAAEIAYREVLAKLALQSVGQAALVDFATAPTLDYLAANVGVVRLAAQRASTTLRFTLVDGHGGVTIPAGTRCRTTDGQASFATLAAATVAAGVNSADVAAEATEPGASVNGYPAGSVTVIVDAQPYLASVTNTETTGGGGDIETDAALRLRIKSAPMSPSTAGSVAGYVHHTRAVSSGIVDVAVITPSPGLVRVYPLVSGGIETPAPTLAAVLAALSASTVRPVCDTVEVLSPAAVDWTVVVSVTLLEGTDPIQARASITAALTALDTARRGKLGADVTASQVIAAVMGVGGVYAVTLPGWSDVVVGAAGFARLTSQSVVVAGYTAG